jgi:hypothetical protein
MIRFVLACIFYSSVAQWGYNEVALVFPSAIPYVNEAVRKVQIPTHNTWSKAAVERYVENASSYFEQAKDAVEDIKELVNDNREVMRRG